MRTTARDTEPEGWIRTAWRLAYRAARNGQGLEWARVYCPDMLARADQLRRET
jgi:hypothetical protein